MTRLFAFTALLGIFCLAPGAWAQAQKEEPIEAERPGFTNGTGTVPVGHLQFETGYLYSRSDAGVHEHRIGDSALLRIPTGANTEFRVGLPAYSFTHVPASASGSGVSSPTSGAGGGSGGENTRGFGDMSVSAKWRFLDAPKPLTRPSLALIVQTTLPTGEPAYRESHLQPQIELDASYDLSDSWSLQSDVFYARPADEGQQFSQWAGAINLQHNFTETTAVFLETYRISPTGANAPSGNYLDGGITHVLNNNTQLDINLGTGLNSPIKHDQFVGVGVAHRW